MTLSDNVKDIIASAFMQKAIVDGRKELGECLRRVDRSLWLAWSSASVAKVIEAELLPAYDTFLAATDRANAVVDEQIAAGTWDPHPFVGVARERLGAFRASRVEISALVKRGASRRELVAAVRAAPR